jgi:hypothetical protein
MRGVPPSAQQATPVSIPAPVGGWNARDPLSTMPETDAIQLDNLINVDGSLRIRKGQVQHATLTGHDLIGTLAVWHGPTGQQLWAIAWSFLYGSNAFNVSTGGTKAIDATWTASGFRQQPHYSTVMFNNVSGYYLYICSDGTGPDAPKYYNGTAWTTPAITGVDATLLVHVNLFKFRLYFAEKNSLNVWYLGIDAIAGPATKLPLGGYFNKGGHIVATGTWTVDGGDGVNDLFCVVTSAGQVAVFAGDSPQSASSWSIIGVFDIGEPVGGFRCLSKFGADLYVTTLDGLYSVRNIMAGQIGDSDAITEKVRHAFSSKAREFKARRGWMALYYPRGKYFFINVPTYNGSIPTPDIDQFVFSNTTKTWSRFTCQWTQCWAIYNDRLYGGRDDGQNVGNPGVIFRADDGKVELYGVTIDGVGGGFTPVRVRQAYTSFGDTSRMKYVTLARPLLENDSGPANVFNITVDVDFDFKQAKLPFLTGLPSTQYITGPDYPPEDRNDYWTLVKRKTAGGGLGRYACISMVTNVKWAHLGWIATEWYFKPAGIIST